MDLNRRVTIRQYLIELLKAIWTEGESFSGKRPFGNGGWQYEIYEALVKNHRVQGSFDEDGYLDECDTKKADMIVLEAIESL